MKKFYASKTFWFFLLSLVVSVAGYFGYADFVPEEAFNGVGLMIVSVVGIILRFVTAQAIE